ncbi:MAG: AbrB/MazE/SpoVT family DNA-binding domain-containing protein [Chloroflexota bacterium]
MAMIKKLTKTGSSYSLIIDKSIMQLLSIDPELPVKITTDGTRLIVEPTKDSDDDEKRKEKFAKALKRSHKKFGAAYQKLAE